MIIMGDMCMNSNGFWQRANESITCSKFVVFADSESVSKTFSTIIGTVCMCAVWVLFFFFARYSLNKINFNFSVNRVGPFSIASSTPASRFADMELDNK